MKEVFFRLLPFLPSCVLDPFPESLRKNKTEFLGSVPLENQQVSLPSAALHLKGGLGGRGLRREGRVEAMRAEQKVRKEDFI